MERVKWILWWLVLPSWYVGAQTRHDVIITEIMCDPSPQVGLPNYEWIELKNVSTQPVNLNNWRLNDATGESGPMPEAILEPDSMLIVSAASAAPFLSEFGKTIHVTSFPSLDNNGDRIMLRTSEGRAIHVLEYDLDWYGNELKKAGGWSLEIIDTHFPCLGRENWSASINEKGGTPGAINSINGEKPDESPPLVRKAITEGNNVAVIEFSEPLDSLVAMSIDRYAIDHNLQITAVNMADETLKKLKLTLSGAMVEGVIYTISINGVRDCAGNVTDPNEKIRTGIPSQTVERDIVINELLFNPRAGGNDYVEVLNASEKIIDASRLAIANRDAAGSLNSIVSFGNEPLYLFPGQYLVVTEDPSSLEREYLVKDRATIHHLSLLPSYPDDKGTVVLLDFQGMVIDEVRYFEDWHFRLIANADGVALERIEPGGPSNEAFNWHSAAATAGYGTPGYKNSQYRETTAPLSGIEITPRVFSPDNDGRDDVCTISYNIPSAGNVANIYIYDAIGRRIRHLVKNAILGLSGTWNWDGLDDAGKQLPIGVYLLVTEIFNLQGKTERVMKKVVLARKF